jgi:3'(2'), 5'-bisphosphate nucleotidase
VNIGSSLKFCLVADGRADLYPRLGAINEWDIAAGHAILKAAGGNVVDLNTKIEIIYNSESLKTPDYIAFRDFELLNKL